MFVARNPDGTIYGKWSVKQWDGQEELPDNHPELNPAPTQSEQFKAIERAFDKHIDDVAAARGYGRNGTSPVAPSEACKGFAGYPNPRQAEAIKFGQWSADCCSRMIQGQADVIAGTRPMPTPEQAIAELPKFIW